MLVMGIGQAGHYIFALCFLSTSFFLA